VRRALIAALVGGCKFSSTIASATDAAGGEAASDTGASDTAGDGSTDCFARWMAGPMLAAATPVPGVNSSGTESDPFLSPDELTIYVTNGDIRVATRPAITAAFSTPVKDTALSSPENDYKMSVTADGLTAFVSTRSAGAETRVRRGIRPTTAQPFNLDNMYVGMVNDGRDQWDPHISGDGLRLYLSPDNGNNQHVAVATRTSLDTPFGTSQLITALASSVKDNDHTLTLDERVVVFSSDRSGARALWYAVRSTSDGSWGTPELLPGAEASDDGAHLSADGCHIYLVSDRAGNADIYVADVQ
jgi:hypothetical protein